MHMQYIKVTHRTSCILTINMYVFQKIVKSRNSKNDVFTDLGSLRYNALLFASVAVNLLMMCLLIWVL